MQACDPGWTRSTNYKICCNVGYRRYTSELKRGVATPSCHMSKEKRKDVLILSNRRKNKTKKGGANEHFRLEEWCKVVKFLKSGGPSIVWVQVSRSMAHHRSNL